MIPKMLRPYQPEYQPVRDVDVVVGRVLGLGPGGVVSAPDIPSRRLALDDSWCGALSSGGVEASEGTLEEEQPAGAVAVVGVSGKGARGEPSARWSAARRRS